MSAPNESNGRPSGPDAGVGVLANLPRTRPQRSTARRTAARKASASAPAGTTREAVAKPKAKAKAKATPAAKAKTTVPRRKAQAKISKPATSGRVQAGTAASKRDPVSAPRRTGAARTPLVKTATSARSSGTARRAPKRPPAPVDESVPRQGFESDMDRASGPVQPPGGTDLLNTAAEIVSELAKASVSSGERLLKDLLGHLPL